MINDRLTVISTGDGSSTFFSDRWQEAFHSHFGAKQESIFKYVIPSQIEEKAKRQPLVRVLDVCYGLGHNTAACLEALHTAPGRVEILGLEWNSDVPKQSLELGLMDIWSPGTQSILQKVARSESFVENGRSVKLFWGDARVTIAQIPRSWADAIYLDPFSPPRCPQLWTVEFIQALADRLKPDGYLLTYSCAAAVRKAMILAGLGVGSTPPLGRRAPGTIAAFAPTPIPELTTPEMELLETRSAIPYRDPIFGTDDATTILERRNLEQRNCLLEPTSQWKRRNRV